MHRVFLSEEAMGPNNSKKVPNSLARSTYTKMLGGLKLLRRTCRRIPLLLPAEDLAKCRPEGRLSALRLLQA